MSGNGFTTSEFKISEGQNSGYQAVNLAYHFGAKHVFLLGFDMCSHNGKARWHENHPKPCGNHNNHESNFKNNFNSMNPPIDVINCSRRTALTAFPRANLDDILSNIT